VHATTNALANQFDVVAIEDLSMVGKTNRKRHLGRALADVSLAELWRQLTYKLSGRCTTLVVVDGFYPSPKTCAACGAVRAELPPAVRVFECSTSECPSIGTSTQPSTSRPRAGDCSQPRWTHASQQHAAARRTSPGHDRRRETLTRGQR